MKTVLIALGLLLASAGAALAQVQITSATYNLSAGLLTVKGNIDPELGAVQFDVSSTYNAHGGGTIERVKTKRATVEGYYTYPHPSQGLLDGGPTFDVTYKMKNQDIVSVNTVLAKTHFPENAILDGPVDVTQICPGGDWAVGAITYTECMPEEDLAVLTPYFDPLPLVGMPDAWCRFDSLGKRQYWPAPPGEDCFPPQEQMDINEMIDTATAWASGEGCFFQDQITTFTVDFSPALFLRSGAGLTPIDGGGNYILLDQVSVLQSEDIRKNLARHEMEHTIQMEIFPSSLYQTWNIGRVWPEALAVAAQIRDNPGSPYVAARYAPWPDRFTGGLSFDSLRSRQLGLFFAWLENNHGFNACDFMLDQHTEFLLAGDEIAALTNHIPAIRQLFGEFVTYYNHRMVIPGIELLPPASAFQEATVGPGDAQAVFNGITEGQTWAAPNPINGPRFSIEPSERCPQDWPVITSLGDAGVGQFIQATGEYRIAGGVNWTTGVNTLTVSSLYGGTHFKELIATDLPSHAIPGDPWPAQDLNDPFPSGCE